MIEMTKEYGYWLFSAMTQATAAIFGVIGMFIIFKLQTLRDAEKEEYRIIVGVLGRFGYSYDGLERQSNKELEQILLDEIIDRERIENITDEEAIKQLKNKPAKINELTNLRNLNNSLQKAKTTYHSTLKSGKEAMKGISFSFVISSFLLFIMPILEKSKTSLFISTIFYGFLLFFSFRNTWCFMRDSSN